MKRKPRKTLSFNMCELVVLRSALDYSNERETYLYDKIEKAYQEVKLNYKMIKELQGGVV